MIGWDGFYFTGTLVCINNFWNVYMYTAHCWNTNLRVNSYERVSFCVELLFERDNNGLEILDWLVLYVVGHLQIKKLNTNVMPFSLVASTHLHWKRPSYKLTNTHLAYVGIIQSSINLIQDKERCRLVAMRERKNTFFFSSEGRPKQTSLLLKKKRKVNGKNGTCEWQKAELKQPQSSLLLTGCPWAWTSFLEPHSCSWFHLSMVLLGSLAPGMPERI